MESFRIRGGKPLSGKVRVDCAKNSILPIIAGACLCEGITVIKNCPEISDVFNMSEILKECGAKVYFNDGDLVIDASGINNSVVSEKKAGKVRASALMLGALSAKTGFAKIALPGGCDIGGRPTDMHVKALEDLGAVVGAENNSITCFSPVKGGRTVLPFPSVGATENALISAVKCPSETLIIGCAKEPEIVDLAEFFKKAGAEVYGAGTSIIRVIGKKRLSGTEFTASGDRIEAGTFLISLAVTGGEGEVYGVNAENISSLLGKLCDNTCKIRIKNDIIYLRGAKRRRAFGVETGPYPMFPTDLQAQASVLCTVSGGTSVIEEKVFDKRFYHLYELKKMGAKVSLFGNVARIEGVPVLHGEKVYSHDLRCGAALILAGLNAEGETLVTDTAHVDRGYCRIENKLKSLGADIDRVNEKD